MDKINNDEDKEICFDIFTQITLEAIFFWEKIEEHLGICPAHIKNILLLVFLIFLFYL